MDGEHRELIEALRAQYRSQGELIARRKKIAAEMEDAAQKAALRVAEIRIPFNMVRKAPDSDFAT